MSPPDLTFFKTFFSHPFFDPPLFSNSCTMWNISLINIQKMDLPHLPALPQPVGRNARRQSPTRTRQTPVSAVEWVEDRPTGKKESSDVEVCAASTNQNGRWVPVESRSVSIDMPVG